MEPEQIWWGEAPERPKIITRVWSESMLLAVTRPESAPSRFCRCDTRSIRNHTVDPRLGQFSGVATRRDLSPPAASIDSPGHSGASPHQVLYPPNNFFTESKNRCRRLFPLSAGSEFGLIGSPLCTWQLCEGTIDCGKVIW